MTVARARPWLRQASSDLRTAKFLFHHAIVDDTAEETSDEGSVTGGDAGCHIAAMCAQTIEKSIKGYVILNRTTPALDHRPDKYLILLLTRTSTNPLLRYPAHQPKLAKLFDLDTRAVITELFNLTPEARGNRSDLPNTEYPWQEDGEWRWSPCESLTFAKDTDWRKWITAASKIHQGLIRLFEAVRRETNE